MPADVAENPDDVDEVPWVVDDVMGYDDVDEAPWVVDDDDVEGAGVSDPQACAVSAVRM